MYSSFILYKPVYAALFQLTFPAYTTFAEGECPEGWNVSDLMGL